ncbi:hypothetical protein BU16DRAFT_527766 [Lophium mytilinum]|uniref:Heterokaryon incompatibility domain-containing protein n=1 Tax=Lophium mytilinum TaxID=390894 RepID=A0A6A6QRH3_9PEZI|nr:hypothetical protein BU16DRAFT_527766 [Lophium mytilinum]
MGAVQSNVPSPTGVNHLSHSCLQTDPETLCAQCHAVFSKFSAYPSVAWLKAIMEPSFSIPQEPQDHHQSLHSFQHAIKSGCTFCRLAWWELLRRCSDSRDLDRIETCQKLRTVVRLQGALRQRFIALECWLDDTPGKEEGWTVFFELYVLKPAQQSQQRMPGVDPATTEFIDLQPWLATCIKLHSCGKSIQRGYIPPRLLDCSDRIRPFEASQIDEKVVDRRYAAVSNCWGLNLMPVVLTTENIQSFYQEIPGLPATFRDATKDYQAARYTMALDRQSLHNPVRLPTCI